MQEDKLNRKKRNKGLELSCSRAELALPCWSNRLQKQLCVPLVKIKEVENKHVRYVLQYRNTSKISFISSVTDFSIEDSWLRFHWTELFEVWAVWSLRKILAFYHVPPLLVLHVYYFVDDIHWKIRGSKIQKISLLLAPTHSPEFAA